MKAAALSVLVLLATTLTARADFSYTTTTKTGGAMAAMAGGAIPQTSKIYLKGQKMKMEIGDTATILDFDSQTITTINSKSKTISVRNFSDLGAAKQSDVSVKIDVRETGQKKVINGYNAKEVIMTMDVDIPQAKQMGQMQMEMDLWLSSDIPGAAELGSFYKKNLDRIPWAALSGTANPATQQSMVEMQRKLAGMNGMQVLGVIKVKPAGGAAAPAMPQMTAAQSAQMQAAMARLQDLQKQGGPAAAAAAQAMARMGGMAGGGSPAGGASNALMEITAESTDFSTAAVPEAAFAVPAGYQQVDPK